MLPLNLKSFCLSLPSIGTTDLSNHSWLGLTLFSAGSDCLLWKDKPTFHTRLWVSALFCDRVLLCCLGWPKFPELKPQSLSLFLFFSLSFHGAIAVWIQGLELSRYSTSWAMPTVLFALVIFQIDSCFYAEANLNHHSSKNLVWQAHTTTQLCIGWDGASRTFCLGWPQSFWSLTPEYLNYSHCTWPHPSFIT
jgi:hypothetical protein